MRTRLAPGAVVHACPSCAGRAAALAVVRRQVPAAVARELWQRARASGTRPIDATPCPSCLRVMARAPLALPDDEPFDVDVCHACQLVWFDPGEADPLPLPASAEHDDALDPWSQRTPGRDEARKPRRRHGRRPPVFDDFVIAGRPKSDSIGPWLVAILLAGNGLIGLCSDTWFEAWACWRDDYSGRRGDRRVLNDVVDVAGSVLMHANAWHLLANVVFVAAYGRAAVARDGEGPWALVVLCGAMLGGVAQLVVSQPGAGPFVGISAGAAALLVWVAVSAPHARVGLPYRASGRWHELSWPALGGALVWIAVQMALLDTGIAPTIGLAALGMLAGAVLGAVLAFVRPCG